MKSPRSTDLLARVRCRYCGKLAPIPLDEVFADPSHPYVAQLAESFSDGQ